MDKELHAEIRRLSLVEKLTGRQIARRLRVCRKTIQRALDDDKPEAPRSRARPSFLDPYKIRIKAILEEYPDLSGVRVYEKFKEIGYPGKITIVRDYLQLIRGSRRKTRAYLRLEPPPGEEAQCDWASFGKIRIDGVMRPLSCFLMVLSYSRMLYLDFSVTQEMEAFLRGHEAAFRFFGGVPKKILYDNLKSVVLSRCGGRIRFNKRFMDFAGHHLFEPVPCRVATGSDKGKVERGVRHVRQNFFAGRSFRDLTDLRIQTIKWRDEVANQRIHGTTHEVPAQRFEHERGHLIKLPDRAYDCSTVVATKVSTDCRIRYDSNIYSVPFKYAGKAVTLRITPSELRVYHQDKQVALHRRCYGRRVVIEDPAHIRGLIKRRGKTKLIKAHEELNNISDQVKAYLDKLLDQDLPHRTHILKLQALRRKYGRTQFLQAIEKCLHYKAFGAHYIERVILQDIERQNRGSEELLPIDNKEICSIEVEQHDPAVYDELYSKEARHEQQRK